MKIKLHNNINNYWCYKFMYDYTQEQFDYIYKHLCFDKLGKNIAIHFCKLKTEIWFYELYINTNYLNKIYAESTEGYQYFKENWGNGVFKLWIYYIDKQELKTIVNKKINIDLIREK